MIRCTGLNSLFDWRHRTLRELADWRFNAVLAMPAAAETAMCSECEAPAEWHTYAISLCHYRGGPEPGFARRDDRAPVARLVGALHRVYPYQLEHQWAGPRRRMSRVP